MGRRPGRLLERQVFVAFQVLENLGDLVQHVGGIALRPVAGLDLSREVSLVAVSGSGNPREARQILTMARQFDWAG